MPPGRPKKVNPTDDTIIRMGNDLALLIGIGRDLVTELGELTVAIKEKELTLTEHAVNLSTQNTALPREEEGVTPLPPPFVGCTSCSHSLEDHEPLGANKCFAPECKCAGYKE